MIAYDQGATRWSSNGETDGLFGNLTPNER
jgi:hypothetical protein